MANKRTAGQNVLVGVRPDGSQIPIRSMIRPDPGNAAAIAKLHEPVHRHHQWTADGEMKIETPSIQNLRERATQQAGNETDADNIMATMPDIEMMLQILVSSIISPHDLITKEINISSGFDLINPSLKGDLIGEIKKYFDEDYKIKDQIQGILENVLGYTGSQPILVLPENAVDELINGRSNFSSEALYELGILNDDNSVRGLGMLCNPYKDINPHSREFLDIQSGKFSFEDIYTNNKGNDSDFAGVRFMASPEEGKPEQRFDIKLRVTDNYNIVRVPLLLEAKRKRASLEAIYENTRKNRTGNRIRSLSPEVKIGDDYFSIENLGETERSLTDEDVLELLGVSKGSTESLNDFFKGAPLTDRSIRSLVYKDRHRTNDTIRVVRTQDQLTRRSIGEPLVLMPSSTAWINVFTPGQEHHQVGAFVLLDATGNFVTKDTVNSSMTSAFNSNPSNKSFASAMLSRVRSNYTGNFDCENPRHQQELLDAYVNIVEADFLARLRNATHGASARISSNQEIYRIMLIRHLAGNMTQALWVPKELFTYFAFDFNNAGIGRSILDKIKVIASLRSIVNMANVKASIRNSIGETIVEVTLDPRDVDPFKTQELIMDMIARTRQEAMPIGVQNPADITEWLARAGIRMSWTGHPGIIDTKIDMRQEGMTYVKPDTDLSEYLEKMLAKAFGLTPEQIDNINQPDHATTIVANNILFAKRVVGYQEKFNPLLSDHCRKMCLYSQNMFETISNTIATQFDSIELTDEMRTRANENPKIKKTIIELVTKDFIESIDVELPKPKNIRIDNQLNELESRERLLDKVLDSMMAEAMFDENLVGELGPEKINMIREQVKAGLMRQYMSEAGIMTEMMGMFTDRFQDSEFKSMYDDQNKIIGTTMVAYLRNIAENVKLRSKMNAAKDALNVSDDGSGGGSNFGGAGEVIGGSDFDGLGEDTVGEGGGSVQEPDLNIDSDDTSDEENSPDLPPESASGF